MQAQLQLDELKRDWIDSAIPKALEVIRDMGQWEAHDLLPYIGQLPVPNYVGSLIAHLKRDGAIREVGFGASKNPKSNSSRVIFWKAV